MADCEDTAHPPDGFGDRLHQSCTWPLRCRRLPLKCFPCGQKEATIGGQSKCANVCQILRKANNQFLAGKGNRVNMLNLKNRPSRLALAKISRFALLFAAGFGVVNVASAAQSIARIWDERALAAIRVDTPHPPAQARNLFSLSVCMYDAWAAYDTNGAIGHVYRAKHTAADVAAARNEAISYAAWRLLKERHFYSKTFAATLAADDAQMTALGYNINNVSR